MKNLLEEIFRLKKEGLNNTQIAKQLGIRRQDIVVIFKYLKDVNPDFFQKLEELERLRGEYLRLKEEAQQEREKAKNEVEHEMFILNAKVSKYKQDLKEKEEKIKELEEEIKKINTELLECLSERNSLENELINYRSKIEKKIDEEKAQLIEEINEVINKKEKIIEDLKNKLKDCKPTKCYLSKFFNILFILGLLGVLGYGIYFYNKHIIKKEYEGNRYKRVCYILNLDGNPIFKNDYVTDYRYKFCYYKEDK